MFLGEQREVVLLRILRHALLQLGRKKAALRKKAREQADLLVETRRDRLLSRQEAAAERLRLLEREREKEVAAQQEVAAMKEAKRLQRIEAADRKLRDKLNRYEEIHQVKTEIAAQRRAQSEIAATVRTAALRAHKDVRARQNWEREQNRRALEKGAMERRIRSKADRTDALAAQKAALAHEMRLIRTQLRNEELFLRERISLMEARGASAGASLSLPPGSLMAGLAAGCRPRSAVPAAPPQGRPSTSGRERQSSGGAPGARMATRDSARRGLDPSVAAQVVEEERSNTRALERRSQELSQLLQAQRGQEAERDRMLAGVTDVRERDRLTRLYNAERQQALALIQELVGSIGAPEEAAPTRAPKAAPSLSLDTGVYDAELSGNN